MTRIVMTQYKRLHLILHKPYEHLNQLLSLSFKYFINTFYSNVCRIHSNKTSCFNSPNMQIYSYPY
jgi:hypothetical protein